MFVEPEAEPCTNYHSYSSNKCGGTKCLRDDECASGECKYYKAVAKQGQRVNADSLCTRSALEPLLPDVEEEGLNIVLVAVIGGVLVCCVIGVFVALCLMKKKGGAQVKIRR